MLRRALLVLPLALGPLVAQDQGDLRVIRQAIQDLQSKDEQTRASGAGRLAAFGPKAKMAVPYLAKALDDTYWVADTARKALERIGPAGVPGLVKAMGDRSPRVRAAVATLLDEKFAGDLDERDARTLVKYLKDDDPDVRLHVAKAVGKSGAGAVHALLSALTAREAEARAAAVIGLVEVGEEAIEPLRRELRNSRSALTREGAALALGGLKAEAAGPELLEAMEDVSGEVAGAAARALGQTGALAEQGIPRMVKGLQHEDPHAREGAIAGLAAYGERAVPQLVQALPVDAVRDGAVEALLRIGTPAMPGLIDGLKDGSGAIRLGVLLVMRRANPYAIADGLIECADRCLDDPAPGIRAAAARTLAHFGPRALKRTDVRRTAKDEDATVRAAAVWALGELGVDPDAVADKDPRVQIQARLAKWKATGGAGAGTRDALFAIANDAKADLALRCAALDALGEMSFVAEDVDLLPLLEVEQPELQDAAARALERTTLPTVDWIRAQRAAYRPRDDIELAFSWLAGAQEEDGSWKPGGPLFGNGITALAVQAFLAAGYTPADAKYGAYVRRAIDFLVQCPADDGVLCSRNSHSFLEVHGAVCGALVEAWIATGDPRCRRVAQVGLDYCAWARNPRGAWRYEPRGGENDTNVTAWMVTAIRLGDIAGLRVDRDAYAGAGWWIRWVTGADGHMGYNYPGGLSARPEGKQERYPADQTEAMTAAGLWCRQLLGGDLAGGPYYDNATDLVRRMPPSWGGGRIDLYYWYYGSLALWQAGSSAWRGWEKDLSKALEKGQLKDGSWPMASVWADDGGKSYPTIMAVLALLTPSRFPEGFATQEHLESRHRAILSALKKLSR